MSGKADKLFVVEPLTRKGQKLGYVGKIKRVNAIPVLDSLKNGQVPIVSPISADERGQAYNVNADSAAAALAVAAQCTDLMYFTDVAGVQVDKKVCSLLTIQEAQDLIADGTIKDGMVAKMESTFEALKGGVHRVHILQWVGANTLAGIINGVCRTGTTLHL
jgi:acetylglutamate kinase